MAFRWRCKWRLLLTLYKGFILLGLESASHFWRKAEHFLSLHSFNLQVFIVKKNTQDPLSSPGPVQASFFWPQHLQKMSRALEILFCVFAFDFLNSKVKIKALSTDSYLIDRSYMSLVTVNYFKDKTGDYLTTWCSSHEWGLRLLPPCPFRVMILFF